MLCAKWGYEMTDLATLRNEYRPYDQLPEFDQGFAAYAAGNFANPYDRNLRYYMPEPEQSKDVAAQAWDRGQECAFRWKREQQKKQA
jgi:hypothetical protein